VAHFQAEQCKLLYLSVQVTLEGVCQSTYSVYASNKDEEEDGTEGGLLNVTKTLDFKRCSKIADVAYGFQTQQPQPQCAQCQMFWADKTAATGWQQPAGQQQQHPCAQQCDPKEVDEQTVRSRDINHFLNFTIKFNRN
jgi:hypothetical protein